MKKTIHLCILMLLLAAKNSTAQKILSAEYFFDTDPGVSMATPFIIPQGKAVNITADIHTDSLLSGFHELFIRFKDNQNRWSIAEQRSFYVDAVLPQKPSPLLSGEYFFTTDPGTGNGQALAFNKTDSLNKAFNIVVPTLSKGVQYLEIRVKDSLGKWSIAESREINIVCKPRLGHDTTVNLCGSAATDITPLYDYVNYASSQWNTPDPTSVGTGIYRLIVTSTLGCSDTAYVTVTNNPLPPPTITAGGSTTFCEGGSVTLTSSKANSYLWSNGAVTRSITVTTAGSYSVTVTNANACSATSNATIVTVNPNPTPTITASVPLTKLCPGTTVTLDAGTGYSSYLWSSGAITQSIIVSVAGAYSVTVTNSNGCSGASAVKNVTYKACPPPTGLKATVTSATTTTLKWNEPDCGSGFQVQYRKSGTTSWTTFSVTTLNYKAKNLMPGTAYEWQVATVCQSSPLTLSAYAVGTNFTTPASAIYQPVADGNSFTFTQVFNAMIFPNPTSSSAVLNISGAKEAVTISITDITGKMLWKSLKVKDSQIILPVEKFANGVYIVTVSNGKENKTMKLIKG